MSATFTEATHQYVEDGVVLPSVTQVLTLSGITDVSAVPAAILARAAQIGSAVHQACHFLDEDDLDLMTLDSGIVGYVLAYQRFKEKTGFVPKLIEHRGIGQCRGIRFGYCLDRIGDIGDDSVLIDLKTSTKPWPSWQIQTAAYCEGYGHEGPRMAVHCHKDGTFDILPHNDEADFLVWKDCLGIAWWKMTHGFKVPR